MKKFFKSKKAWTMMLAVVGVLSTAITGAQEWSPALMQSVGIVMTYIAAQGIADFGKEKNKEDSRFL